MHFSSNPIDANNEVDKIIKTAVDAENPSFIHHDDITLQPIFKVIFRDESVSRQYRQKIRNFLHTLVQSTLSCEEDMDTSNLILEVWDNKNPPNNLSINTENNIPLSSNHIRESSDITCDLLFTIDTQPKLTNDFDVPTYGKKYESTFEKSDSETSKDSASKMSCFNCKGNHNLRDCLLPRNYANINKNRKDFTVKYMKSGVRYHLNEEQKFSHIIPGQLSQKLRAALGLKDNELPKHIYRMRSLGYPPGWLEEVCLQPSGLSLFNSDGIAETDPNDESQEREITIDINRDQYDIKKIYDFPGFNVPPPPGTIDESYKFYAPQMHPMHSKEAMLLCLQGKETDDGYKRKKLKLSTSANVSESIPCEMDIEDSEDAVMENVLVNGHFVLPLPKELTSLPLPPPPPPPPPLPPLSPPPLLPPPPPSPLRMDVIEDSDLRSQELLPYDSADDAILSRANSPSLSELESMKKQLLVELEETSLQFNPGASSKNNTNITITSEDNIQLNRSPTLRKSLNTSSVKSVDLGTPILQSTSPYNKLPLSEKFSKNICDVINFENLPDSTGKYKQMTVVLQKVRNTIAKIHRI